MITVFLHDTVIFYKENSSAKPFKRNEHLFGEQTKNKLLEEMANVQMGSSFLSSEWALSVIYTELWIPISESNFKLACLIMPLTNKHISLLLNAAYEYMLF